MLQAAGPELHLCSTAHTIGALEHCGGAVAASRVGGSLDNSGLCNKAASMNFQEILCIARSTTSINKISNVESIVLIF